MIILTKSGAFIDKIFVIFTTLTQFRPVNQNPFNYSIVPIHFIRLLIFHSKIFMEIFVLIGMFLYWTSCSGHLDLKLPVLKLHESPRSKVTGQSRSLIAAIQGR